MTDNPMSLERWQHVIGAYDAIVGAERTSRIEHLWFSIQRGDGSTYIIIPDREVVDATDYPRLDVMDMEPVNQLADGDLKGRTRPTEPH